MAKFLSPPNSTSYILVDSTTNPYLQLTSTGGSAATSYVQINNGDLDFLSSTTGKNITIRTTGVGKVIINPAQGTTKFGALVDSAIPVAQTITFMGSRGGIDTDTAGANTTFIGSLGTGTAASGTIIFQVGTPQTTGTTQHVAATALTISNIGTSGTAAITSTFVGTATASILNATTQIQSPNGTQAAPGLALSGTAYGAFTGTNITYSYNNVQSYTWRQNSLGGRSGFVFGWASGSSPDTQSLDTGISRISAATLGIGNGTAGNVYGGVQANDITLIGSVNTPGAPTITNGGTPGATTYAYKLIYNFPDGTHTDASLQGSTTTGNVTLNGTNYNIITFTLPTGAASADIYRNSGGATQGKIITASTTSPQNDTGLTGNGVNVQTIDNTSSRLTSNSLVFTGDFIGTSTVPLSAAFLFRPTGATFGANYPVGWSATNAGSIDHTSGTRNVDVAFSRGGVGILSLGTGSAGNASGTLQLATITPGSILGSDVVPATLTAKAQSAWSRASTNVTGANLFLAGGIGRRFFTVVSFAGVVGKTATLTVNNTAVTLTEGVDFNAVTSNNQTATNLGAAITANVTLGPLVTVTVSSAIVYIDPKAGLNYFTITSNAGSGNMSSTSGADGSVVVPAGTAFVGGIAFPNGNGISTTGGGSIQVIIGGETSTQIAQTTLSLLFDSSAYRLGAASDCILTRRAAAGWQFGEASAAAPVAQTISFQGSRGGTDTDVAGVSTTIQGSLGTGLAASGTILFKVGTPQATGTTQHVANTILTLQDTGVSNTPAPLATFASPISAQGAFWGYVVKTANYTLTAADSLVECTTNSFTITLPTAVGITGRVYYIKNSGNTTITVNCTGGQTIDGQTTQTLVQYDCMTVMSNNANWMII